MYGGLDGLTAGLVQQGSQFQLRGDGVLEFGVQAAGQQRGRQLFHLLGIGGFVHTVDKGHLVGAACVGGALVSQQHELLNHALRSSAAALDDVHAAAVFIDDELGFVGLDLHAAALLAQHQALAVQLVHDGQLLQYLGVLLFQGVQHLRIDRFGGLVGFNRFGSFSGHGFQQGVDLFVHALDAAADDGLDEVVA